MSRQIVPAQYLDFESHFDPDFVYHMATLAKASYECEERFIATADEQGWQAPNFYSWGPIQVGICEVQILFARYIVVVFRGTRGFWDFIIDAMAWKTRLSVGKMHFGFQRYLKHGKSPLLRILNRRQYLRGDTEVVLVGHSLGGAAAIGTALDVLPWKVITFGCPRVFDEDAALEYDNTVLSGIAKRRETLGDRTLRVVTVGANPEDVDPVTQVPLQHGLIPSLHGFKHVGQSLCLGPNRVHRWENIATTKSRYESVRVLADVDQIDELHHMETYLSRNYWLAAQKAA